jgi:hypothetical protein
MGPLGKRDQSEVGQDSVHFLRVVYTYLPNAAIRHELNPIPTYAKMQRKRIWTKFTPR